MFLLKPGEQAFGQRDTKLEVGIEGLVKVFRCSLWHRKTSVIGGLEFRCFPIGGIGASTNFEDVCLLKSPLVCLLSLCVSLKSWGSSFGDRTGGDWLGRLCLRKVVSLF